MSERKSPDKQTKNKFTHTRDTYKFFMPVRTKQRAPQYLLIPHFFSTCTRCQMRSAALIIYSELKRP